MSLPAPTVTGWSSFWQLSAPSGQGGAYSMYGNRYAIERRIDQLFGRSGYRANRELVYTLLGAATGNAASDTYKRVKAPAGLTEGPLFGGAREIETDTTVNRNTTAAGLTHAQNLLKRAFDMAPTIANYPADASGNGGGGKAGW